jgi:integrase
VKRSRQTEHQQLATGSEWQRQGKTPVLTADEARALLDAIPIDTLIGLRDRALIGVMVYTFARVNAVIGMQ